MNCSNCNTKVLPGGGYCPNCGTPVNTQDDSMLKTEFSNQAPYASSTSNYNIIPPEINKWNWGAFYFNMIWGIGNNAYLTLLCLVPFLNIVWIFVCGANGNKWAWESGKFKNVEEFLAVQKTWNRAGLFMFILQLVLLIPMIFIFMSFAAFITYGLNTYSY